MKAKISLKHVSFMNGWMTYGMLVFVCSKLYYINYFVKKLKTDSKSLYFFLYRYSRMSTEENDIMNT